MAKVDVLEKAAELLGLHIVRLIDESMFGAAIVEDVDGSLLILKASTNVALAEEWSTGAAMATLLRERGYPASHFFGTGAAGELIWSLQTVLPGRVPSTFTLDLAEQVVALARLHDIDCGMRRQWDAQAREITQRALAALGPLPEGFDATLRSVLDATTDVVLEQATVVHGDFHHRNFLVDDGMVSGVFDWDIAGPGDWRFDLVNLAFGCQMYPRTCEREAIELVVGAAWEHCDASTAAFLMACQVVRSLSMLHTGRPEWLDSASTRMQATLAEWWT